jgi:hypothetical protein
LRNYTKKNHASGSESTHYFTADSLGKNPEESTTPKIFTQYLIRRKMFFYTRISSLEIGFRSFEQSTNPEERNFSRIGSLNILLDFDQ